MSYLDQLRTEYVARRQRIFGNIGKPIVRAFRKPPPPPSVPAPSPKWSRMDSILTLAPVAPGRPSIPAVLDLVATAHGIKVSDMLSGRRTRHLILAKAHAIATLCEWRKDLSLPAIGARLGLDHTTVLHHRDNWPKARERCPNAVAAVYAQMEKFSRLEPFCAEPADSLPMIG